MRDTILTFDAEAAFRNEPLRDEILACRCCSLRNGCRAPVPWSGWLPSISGLAIVGEAPGANEDLQGRPFVGESGEVLDEALRLSGLDRDIVPVINVVCCRPPGNRNPEADEVFACGYNLQRQLEAANPLVILTLGRFAGIEIIKNTGLDPGFSVFRNRGRFYRGPVFNLPDVTVIPTWHPSPFNSRNPKKRREILDDVTRAATALWEKTLKKASPKPFSAGFDAHWMTFVDAMIEGIENGYHPVKIRRQISRCVSRCKGHPVAIRELLTFWEAVNDVVKLDTEDQQITAFERMKIGARLKATKL